MFTKFTSKCTLKILVLKSDLISRKHMGEDEMSYSLTNWYGNNPLTCFLETKLVSPYLKQRNKLSMKHFPGEMFGTNWKINLIFNVKAK
jgi:hypothetical protein